MNNNISKQIEIIENLGWCVKQYDNELEIENYSPLGENLVEYLDINDIEESCKNLYENYDADEHAALWIEHRGVNGCPSSVIALAEDAKQIESMYYNLYQKIS